MIQALKSVASKIWMNIMFNYMSRIGQHLGHLDAYKVQILYMDTLYTKEPIVIIVAIENRLPWQQRGISISKVSKGV